MIIYNVSRRVTEALQLKWRYCGIHNASHVELRSPNKLHELVVDVKGLANASIRDVTDDLVPVKIRVNP